MTAQTVERTSAGAQQSAGKHLTFNLQRESYGIDVLKVREIIRLTNITAVPQMPDYAKGVINLRGKIIPVIDLRRRFGFDSVKDTELLLAFVQRLRNMTSLWIRHLLSTSIMATKKPDKLSKQPIGRCQSSLAFQSPWWFPALSSPPS